MPATEIQNVARQLFAHQGYHGTSVREITDGAKVNVGAITYHFGSKLELYHRVLEDLTSPLVERMAEIGGRGLAPLDRIQARMQVFFEHVRSRPEMIPLMVREMASAEEVAPPIRRLLQTVVPTVLADIREGQQQGAIRAGDPLLLTISTMAQPVYMNLSRKGIALATGKDPLKEDFDATVSHCVTMVRAMLEAA